MTQESCVYPVEQVPDPKRTPLPSQATPVAPPPPVSAGDSSPAVNGANQPATAASAGGETAPPSGKKKKGGEGEGKKREKKEKKSSEAAAGGGGSVDVSRLDFRIGRIISVERHPDADSLYVEQSKLPPAMHSTCDSP